MEVVMTELYFGSGHEQWTYFGIEAAPGPFRLVAEEVKSHEPFGGRFVVELTVVPMYSGEKLLGHNNSFKIPFEVALHGATNSLGTAVGDPPNVRLLGRFSLRSEVLKFIPEGAYEVLYAWHWEALFGSNSRGGLVFRLKEPLPGVWTF